MPESPYSEDGEAQDEHPAEDLSVPPPRHNQPPSASVPGVRPDAPCSSERLFCLLYGRSGR